VLDGKYDAAMAAADEDIKTKPKSANPYNQRCWLRAIAGRDLDEALADCNQALAIEEHDAGIFDSRGLVEFKLGKLKEARADYDSALDLAPRMQTSLFVRGIIELRNGNTEAGNADIDAAEKREPLIASRFAAYGVSP
jgi:tetratricopeptide (TPR) repeat protein